MVAQELVPIHYICTVDSKELREGAEALVTRSIETVQMMIERDHAKNLVRGGRKAQILE